MRDSLAEIGSRSSAEPTVRRVADSTPAGVRRAGRQRHRDQAAAAADRPIRSIHDPGYRHALPAAGQVARGSTPPTDSTGLRHASRRRIPCRRSSCGRPRTGSATQPPSGGRARRGPQRSAGRSPPRYAHGGKKLCGEIDAGLRESTASRCSTGPTGTRLKKVRRRSVTCRQAPTASGSRAGRSTPRRRRAVPGTCRCPVSEAAL